MLLPRSAPTGFRFHTDARSRKAAELAADSRVALVLAFPDRPQPAGGAGPGGERRAEAPAAYERRSAYLRQLAWLNDAEHARLRDEDGDGPGRTRSLRSRRAPRPAGVVAGFEVVPHRYVFWEGGADRASRPDRVRPVGDGWITTHLPG